MSCALSYTYTHNMKSTCLSTFLKIVINNNNISNHIKQNKAKNNILKKQVIKALSPKKCFMVSLNGCQNNHLMYYS